jgi:tRNA A37 threonylcarbamoyltransferase TsaD
LLLQDSCNFSFSGLKTSVAKLISDEQARLGGDIASVIQPGVATTTTVVQGAAPASVVAGEPPVTGGNQAAGSGAVAPGETAAQTATDNKATQQPEISSKADELRRSAADIAASFQKVAVAFLQQRTRRALQWLKVGTGQDFKEMG